MKVALAGDHGGFRLKEQVACFFRENGIEYNDFGTFSEDPVDYPDIALKVAEAVRNGDFDRGVICCGTGIGVAITANKVPGIRASQCHDTFSARAAREHNNANVLTLGERVIGFGLAREIVRVWLEAEFQGGRHAPRVDKISLIEQKYNSCSR
ncbi:ribose 5-phosphate isomerase B [Pelotomaculum propionicicum]|uniref:ribose 5-phosphate isomerase B n=1 Tax=Pelotomaculum propionicicum TaxID=258475 RepID=UPI003B773472